MTASTSTDAQLLALLGLKGNHGRFRNYVSKHVLGKEATKVLEWLDRNVDPANDINWKRVRTDFQLRAVTGDAGAELVDMFLDKVQEAEAAGVDDTVIEHAHITEVASKLVDVGERVLQGVPKSTLSDAFKVVKDYETLVSGGGVRAAVKQHEIILDPTALASTYASGSGLAWKLECMNLSLGSLRDGNFIIVGSRPETGKTSFLLQEAVHMALHTTEDRPVLFLHNEEAAHAVQLRAMQALLNYDSATITSDLPACSKAFKDAVGKRFILWAKSQMRLDEIEAAIQDYNPCLVVYNVLPKVKDRRGKGNTTDHEHLAELFCSARDFCTQYGHAGIAAMQANAECEGQAWIYQNQLHGSKTDVAGEGDGIITIGKMHDPAKDNKRYFHVPKNKLPEGGTRDPKESHGYWEVDFNRHICLYTYGGKKAGPPIGGS